MTDTTTTKPKNVIEAIAAVMADMPGIGRDQRSEQGYQYRGIEAITRHLQGLLAKHCVVFVPKVRSRKVKDLTINSRPWTQDELEISYRVYGPGGVDDFIDVGPVIGLGRDNSDKGSNKAASQAFKYALLQTFCIGDGKDDTDHDTAHVADAPDPEEQQRRQLRNRIGALPPAAKAALRKWCDDQGVARVVGQMTIEQVEQADDFLDVQAQTTGEEPETPAPDEQSEPVPEGEPTITSKAASQFHRDMARVGKKLERDGPWCEAVLDALVLSATNGRTTSCSELIAAEAGSVRRFVGEVETGFMKPDVTDDRITITVGDKAYRFVRTSDGDVVWVGAVA